MSRPGKALTKARPRPTRGPSLAQRYLLGETLQAARRVPLRGRVGTSRVWISCVWSELLRCESPVTAGATRSDFGGWLVRAHRAGLLRLARASSFEEWPAALLTSSLVRSSEGGSEFHLIVDPFSDPFPS